jgi:hypothetical protein
MYVCFLLDLLHLGITGHFLLLPAKALDTVTLSCCC